MPAAEATIDPAVCGQCGAVIPRGAPLGQCPRCLLSLVSGFGKGALDAELLDAGQVRSFGDYELVEELARGGMGVVYRARQLSLGREVAVKMILAGELATAESVQRFRNEAAAAARLEHPNIVAVYEIGENETQHWFSMRLVPGGRNVADWAKALPAEGRAGRIAKIMGKVAGAVAFAHERGVLHRDLKPSNILVDEKGEPQVTDFGLAKLLSEQDSGLTRSVAALGSPSYMAPEQAGGRLQEVTTATDVYGLGAVLYEMLAGRPPFLAGTALATLQLVQNEPPAALAGVPRDLATICLQCLEKSAARRYASAREVAEELERFGAGKPIFARPVTRVEHVWRWALRNRALAVTLTAGVLALAAGIGGVLWQWRQAERARGAQAVALAGVRAANAALVESEEHLRWQEMDGWLERGDPARALARTAQILRADPGDWRAATFAMSIVDQHAFPFLATAPMSLPPLAAPPQLSADGKWIVAAGADWVVRVWKSETGEEVAKFKETALAASNPVEAVWRQIKADKVATTACAMGGAGPMLALGAPSGQVTVRSLAAGKLGSAVALAGPGGSIVRQLSFAAQGPALLARADNAVRVWPSVGAGVAPVRMTLPGGVVGAAISGDGARVVRWNRQRCVVQAVAGGEELGFSSELGIEHATISADGRRVAVTGTFEPTRVWEIATRKELRVLPHLATNQMTVALNATGTRVIVGGGGLPLTVHDVDSGLLVSREMWTHKTSNEEEVAPAWLAQPWLNATGDGQTLISAGIEGAVCTWDASSGEPLAAPMRFRSGREMPLPSASSDGRGTLIFQREKSAISLWRRTVVRAPEARHPAHGSEAFNGALSPDGNTASLVVREGEEFRHRLLALKTGAQICDERAEGVPYLHVFHPTAPVVFLCAEDSDRKDNRVLLSAFATDSGKRLWTAEPQRGSSHVGAVAPDGEHLVMASKLEPGQGALLIFKSATGALEQSIATKEILVVRFAPDGSGRFLTTEVNGPARLWDAGTGREVKAIGAQARGSFVAASWSPDARRLALADYAGVSVWDVERGAAVGQALPHGAWLSHLEFCPDGRTLATACRDGTVRLWDSATGQALCPPRRQGTSCDTIRFSPDGRTFLVRDTTGFRFWSADRAEPVTVHYRAPYAGTGTSDCEAYRAMLSPDGTRVFLADSIAQSGLWTVEKAVGTVPAWFPDFLETLALLRIDATRTPVLVAGEQMMGIREKIAGMGEEEPYGKWARRVLGE